MGSYDNGVSMRALIEEHFKRAEKLLNVSPMYDTERQEVLSILKLISWYWCRANAYSRSLEETAKKVMSDHDYAVFARRIATDMDGIQAEVFRKTYPFE